MIYHDYSSMFLVCKSRLKKTTHMVISTVVGKAFGDIYKQFIIKAQQARKRQKFLQLV